MSTQDIIATLRDKAIKRFTKDLDELLGELEAELRQGVQAEQLEIITNTLMPKRKKIAETEEVAMERGMTLEEIALHNAEVTGWNKRGNNLRKKLLGTKDEEVVDEEVPTPAPEPVPEPTPAPVKEPEPEPVP